MIEVEQVLRCKQLAAEGWSFRRISRETGIARRIVRKYMLGEASPGVYRMKQPRRRPVQEQVLERIRALLREEQHKQTPRKQRLTASRIHRILVAEGSEISAPSARRAVRDVRRALRDPLQHAYVPLRYAPGVDAQVDFFESEVDDVEHGRQKVFTLLVRACYSTRTFAYVAPNQTREALFEGLTRSFEFFGGVFHKLWFDNLTPAVKKVLRGRTRQVQEAFTQFAAHYGFEAEFCAPAAGWEKGGVEGQVKYSRIEVLAPIPTVKDRPDIQRLFDAWMSKEVARIPASRTRSIGELWQDEVPLLLPLPATRFDAALTRVAKVTPRSWIALGTNFYSVPVRLVDHEVTVKVSAEEVSVFDRDGEVARHPRCYGHQQMVLDVMHYLPLLLRKHRALDRAVPVQQWLESHGPCFTQWLGVLRQQQGQVDGSKAFVETLMLCDRHPIAAVTVAVQRALSHPSASLAVVRFFLSDERERVSPPPAAFAYPGPQVCAGSTKSYARLCDPCPESKPLVRIDPGATAELETTALPETRAGEPFGDEDAALLTEVAHG